MSKDSKEKLKALRGRVEPLALKWRNDNKGELMAKGKVPLPDLTGDPNDNGAVKFFIIGSDDDGYYGASYSDGADYIHFCRKQGEKK